MHLKELCRLLCKQFRIKRRTWTKALRTIKRKIYIAIFPAYFVDQFRAKQILKN